MSRFNVVLRETSYCSVEIEADTEDDACEQAEQMYFEGDIDNFSDYEAEAVECRPALRFY
jgi:hypothetical protein